MFHGEMDYQHVWAMNNYKKRSQYEDVKTKKKTLSIYYIYSNCWFYFWSTYWSTFRLFSCKSYTTNACFNIQNYAFESSFSKFIFHNNESKKHEYVKKLKFIFFLTNTINRGILKIKSIPCQNVIFIISDS